MGSPPGEYWSSDRVFFCAVSLLSIESRLPAETPTKSRGRPMRAMSAGESHFGCATMPTLKPRPSRKRATRIGPNAG